MTPAYLDGDSLTRVPSRERCERRRALDAKLSSLVRVAYAFRRVGGRALPGVDELANDISVLAHVRGHYVMARWRNILIVYWLSQGTVQAVQNIDALFSRDAAGMGGKFSCVYLIKDGAGLPDHETRLAVRALHDRQAQRIACLGIVLMGDGFWASALQSVFTALRILGGKRPSLMRFARTTVELVAWLPAEHASRTGVRVNEQEFVAAMARVLEVGDAPPALAS